MEVDNKKKDYSSRNVEEYNIFRKIFQYIACNHFVKLGMKSKYNILDVSGLDYINPKKIYIVASNHITNLDPFFIRSQLNIPIAYMAKKELFEPFWSRILMDFCGAFAVDREHVSSSTIKTALSIKKTKWSLGIFPQGTRCHNGKLENVTKGFASLAKKMKLDVLPISIIKADVPSKNGKFDIQVVVDRPISHEMTVDEIYEDWCCSICDYANLEMN